jgi:hypothetical protein
MMAATALLIQDGSDLPAESNRSRGSLNTDMKRLDPRRKKYTGT